MPYRSDLPVPLNEIGDDRAYFTAQTQLRDTPVSLPVPNSTRSFWLHPSEVVNPLAKEGCQGPLASDADICIIGSGITGVSAAYHLSKSVPNRKVVILEARDFCSGATGRNGGHLTPNPMEGLVGYVKSMGVEEAKKQFALERHTVHAVVSLIKENGFESYVDFVSGGHVNLLFTAEELEGIRADYELAKEIGVDVIDVEFLSKDETLAKYGAAYPAVRSAGHNLWPLKLVTKLFYLAKEAFSMSAGVLDLFTSAPVTSVSSISSNDSGRRWLVETRSRGSISCTAVLHATNAYASHILPHLAGPNGIIPVRGQIIAMRASRPFSKEDRASWSANEGFEYWFPRPSKEVIDEDRPLIILGGGRESTDNREIGTNDDSNLNSKVGKSLREFLPAVFPGKYEKGTEPEWEWTGIMGFTALRDPLVGTVIAPDGSELVGQYIAAGFSGHGMPRTFGCAEAVTSLLAHDMTGRPRSQWVAPKWLPTRYLTWNMYLVLEASK